MLESRKGSETTVTEVDPRDWSCRQLPFVAMATLWVLAVFAVSRDWAMEQLAFVGIGMLLLGVPMCLAGICSGTLRQQRRAAAFFLRQGWLYDLWVGRTLRILMWTIWGLGMSFLLLLQFHVYERAGWVVLILIIPLFSVISAAIHRRLLNAGMHADVAVTQALAWSRWICPALFLVLYVLAMTWLGDPPQHATIDAAITAKKVAAADEWGGNALVGEALRGLAYFHGLEAFVLGNLRSMDVPWGLWMLALFGTSIGNFALLYNACLALSFFRIPRAGFIQANLVPRSAAAAFKVVVVTTFLSVFIFPQLLAQLEPWASEFASHRKKVEETTTSVVEALLPVEQINGDVNCSGGGQIDADEHRCLYRQGTVERIKNARTEAASSVGAAADQLRGEVNAAFARLENDAVNEYLDWYYSLTGEYGRIIVLLTGGTSRLEGYLTEKADETFGREQWFAGVNTGIERVFAADENARTAYEQAVRDILDRNRIDPQHAAVEVVLTKSLEDILQPSFYQDFIPAAHRFGVAGAAGSAAGAGVGGIIAQKVTAKMLGKSVIKLAAKAPVKALASKVGAGALAGAAAGTVSPVAGTAAGAFVGILVGIAGGVAIDGALLELEETLSREDRRREIIAAIREARREFETQYLGTQGYSSSTTAE